METRFSSNLIVLGNVGWWSQYLLKNIKVSMYMRAVIDMTLWDSLFSGQCPIMI